MIYPILFSPAALSPFTVFGDSKKGTLLCPDLCAGDVLRQRRNGVWISEMETAALYVWTGLLSRIKISAEEVSRCEKI